MTKKLQCMCTLQAPVLFSWRKSEWHSKAVKDKNPGFSNLYSELVHLMHQIKTDWLWMLVERREWDPSNLLLWNKTCELPSRQVVGLASNCVILSDPSSACFPFTCLSIRLTSPVDWDIYKQGERLRPDKKKTTYDIRNGRQKTGQEFAVQQFNAICTVGAFMSPWRFWESMSRWFNLHPKSRQFRQSPLPHICGWTMVNFL